MEKYLKYFKICVANLSMLHTFMSLSIHYFNIYLISAWDAHRPPVEKL